MDQLECPRVICPLVSIPFGVTYSLYSVCRKKEMLHMSEIKVEIYVPKVGFMDYKWSNLNAPG